MQKEPGEIIAKRMQKEPGEIIAKRMQEELDEIIESADQCAICGEKVITSKLREVCTTCCTALLSQCGGDGVTLSSPSRRCIACGQEMLPRGKHDTYPPDLCDRCGLYIYGEEANTVGGRNRGEDSDDAVEGNNDVTPKTMKTLSRRCIICDEEVEEEARMDDICVVCTVRVPLEIIGIVREAREGASFTKEQKYDKENWRTYLNMIERLEELRGKK